MAHATLPATIYTPQGIQEYQYKPSSADFERMDMALAQAQEAAGAGDSPIGSVLITPNGVYADQTREFRDGDLFGHAEMRSIQAARPEVGRYLGQCILYTTAEPCVGCSYICDKGQLGMLIVAATRNDAPEFFRRRNTNLEDIWGDSRRTLTVVTGLRKAESAKLLTADTKRH